MIERRLVNFFANPGACSSPRGSRPPLHGAAAPQEMPRRPSDRRLTHLPPDMKHAHAPLRYRGANFKEAVRFTIASNIFKRSGEGSDAHHELPHLKCVTMSPTRGKSFPPCHSTLREATSEARANARRALARDGFNLIR